MLNHHELSHSNSCTFKPSPGMIRFCLLLRFLFVGCSSTEAVQGEQGTENRGGQSGSYDLLIKGGHVIDPKNSINGRMDVAVKDGVIARVAENISSNSANRVVNAEGLYVTPGLIDLHGHHFHGTKPNHYLSNSFTALPPDGFTFRSGVTTAVDAGGPGWRNFSTFKEQVIDRSQTRVLSFINIVRSEEHTSELQSRGHLVCRLLLEKITHADNRRGTGET